MRQGIAPTSSRAPSPGSVGDVSLKAGSNVAHAAQIAVLPGSVVVPPAASWNPYNVTTAVISDTASGVAIAAPSNGALAKLQGFERPAAAGFDIKDRIAHNIGRAGQPFAGIYVRDAAGKAVAFGLSVQGGFTGIGVTYYASPAVITSTPIYSVIYGSSWLTLCWRMRDDGVNIQFQVSSDGTQWSDIGALPRAANIGVPVAAGVYVDAYSDTCACVLEGSSGH